MGRPGVAAATVLDEFIAGLGLPRTLGAIGVGAEQIPTLAENCMLDDWTFSNPRKIRAPEEVAEILERAL